MSVVGELEFALRHYPLLLTVEEAAEVLRIGRSLAYELARRYERSGGREGLPVIRVGACLRVPRWALVELLATGRVVCLVDARDVEHDRADPAASDLHGEAEPFAQPTAEEVRRTATKQQRRPRSATSRRPRRSRPDQQLILLPSD
ncbi:MAG: helix-turn-helix domain-containing protein [Ilumatobacteraceae bacterium]